MNHEPLPPDDPLKLESIDREIRIQKTRNEINDLAGGEMLSGRISDCPPELEEAFLDHVLQLELKGFVCPLDELKLAGLQLPTADSLDDSALTRKLWELILAMAARRLYLSSTDHLSDRQLYTWLLEEGLREEMMGFGLPFGNCHIDVIGSGSDEGHHPSNALLRR